MENAGNLSKGAALMLPAASQPPILIRYLSESVGFLRIIFNRNLWFSLLGEDLK
jgi:hypothetical protein